MWALQGALGREQETSTCPLSPPDSGPCLCSDMKKAPAGAGLLAHGPLPPQILGPSLILTILSLAWSFVTCLGPQILKLRCPWLLIVRVWAGAGGHSNTHRLVGTQGPGLGLQEGSCLNVFFMKFHRSKLYFLHLSCSLAAFAKAGSSLPHLFSGDYLGLF